jgi:hypothetical protein
MTGKLYIDGNDAYVKYRIFVEDGGYNELISFPALKAVDSNVWAEDDGAEFDLSAPALDTRELSVKFAFHGTDALFGVFMELLSDMAYHTFNFAEIGRTYRLRLVNYSGFTLKPDMGLFTLHFADDFPLEGYTYTAPVSSIFPEQGYELDGRDFSEYGIHVLQGSAAEVLKSPAVKKNLLTNIKSRSGAIYDGEYVRFETKDVKLNCLMRAESLPELWRNYDALLYDLSRPDERVLYVDSTGYDYPCFYKGCAVEKFAPNGKIWLQFSLTLTFTSFRVDGEEFLLATEDGQLIITEQDDCAIDLFPMMYLV